MDDLNYSVERGVGGKRPFSDDDHNGGPAVKRINVNIGMCPPIYFCRKYEVKKLRAGEAQKY